MPVEPAPLPRRQLGKTGWQVTQLGYGSMGLRGPRTWGIRVVDEEQAEKLLHAVLDAGINFIDTSPDYGICEERIGCYLSRRRTEYFLATKCGCDPVQHADHLEPLHTWTKATIQRNIETSLKRLQTDHIDLVQFHGGDAETLLSAGLIDQLVDYREQGIIGQIGVSTSGDALEGMLGIAEFATFQIRYSCLECQHSTSIAKVRELGAGVIIRGGIAQGGPDAEIQRPNLNEIWERCKLNELVPSGLGRAAFLLRLTLSNPACDTTIVGTANLDHLQSNVKAAKQGPLSKELVAEVERRVAAVVTA